jgi:putative membrane protein
MLEGSGRYTAMETMQWAPYCGPAPQPADLFYRWNFDPILLLALAAAAVFYVARRHGPLARDGLAAGALAALIIAFVSPLCALSSALFSARTLHHALLVLVAAPLLAFALPRPKRAPGLVVATLAHTLLFWLWHAPGAYAWALSSDAAYWLMQASIGGSAFVYWRSIRGASPLPACAALLAAMLQTGLLGALITFAPQPLYAPHLASTGAWGLTPLADQQAAGLIMWAPMAAGYLFASLALMFREISPRPAAAIP